MCQREASAGEKCDGGAGNAIAPYAPAKTVEWLTLTYSLMEVQVGFLGEHPRWSSP